MIKFRKLHFYLAIAYTLAMLINCFSAAGVFASSIALSDDDYKNASSALKVICPDFPLSDKEVTTRGEFVASVAMIMNMPSSSVTPNFADVDSSHPYAACIASAVGLGLIDNVDLFYPESPITYNQAIKIVMTAAGYGDKAIYTGGYPSGYLKAANDAGVGVNISGSTDAISHAQATELIFEAATVDMMEISGFGDKLSYTVTEGKNILSVYHDIYVAEGVVDANEYTSLISISESTTPGTVTVNGVAYRGDGYANYIGKRVRIFFTGNKMGSILHMYECGNKVYTYSDKDSLFISGNNLTVSSDTAVKDENYRLTDSYSVICNGKFYGLADYNKCINPSSGTVTLVDNNDDKAVDVIIVKNIDYGVIGSVNVYEEKIYDKYKKGGMINLGDSEVKYYISESDGAPLTLADLEGGNAVGYVISDDGKLCEIIRYTEKVGGEYNSRTSEGKIVVNDVEYDVSEYYTENVKSVEKIKFGVDVILHLGEEGKIIYVEEFSSSVKYGFLAAADKDQGIDGDVAVMIYGVDGKMHKLSLAEKIKYNGVSKTKNEAKAEFDALFARAEDYKNLPDDQKLMRVKEKLIRVVKFSVNVEGKLNKIYTAEDNILGADANLFEVSQEARPIIYSLNSKEDHGGDKYYKNEYIYDGKVMYEDSIFYPLFHLAPGASVMQVPQDLSYAMDEDYYRIHDISSLNTVTDGAQNIACYAFDVGREGASFALWVLDGGASSEVGLAATAVVESVSQGLTENGEDVKIIRAYYNKEWRKFYAPTSYGTTESELALKDTIEKIQPGDMVQILADHDGFITSASINFSYFGYDGEDKYVNPDNKAGKYVSGNDVAIESGYLFTNANKKAIIMRGDVERADGTTSRITPDDIASGNYKMVNTYSANLGRGDVVFVKFNRDRVSDKVTGAVVYRESSTDVAESFFTSGKDADFLVQRNYNNDVSMTVIYTN